MTNTSSSSATRHHIGEIDHLRAFAILAVITIHVASLVVVGDTSDVAIMTAPVDAIVWGNAFLGKLAHFAVPVFILISGLVLALRWYEKVSLRAFYWQRAKRILVPYLIFSLGYMLPELVAKRLTLPRLLYNLVTSHAHYHFWFFAVIIQLYVLYPLLVWIYRQAQKRGHIVLSICFLWLLQVLWNIITLRLDAITAPGTVSLPLLGNVKAASLLGVLKMLLSTSGLSHIFYFYLGLVLGRALSSGATLASCMSIARGNRGARLGNSDGLRLAGVVLLALGTTCLFLARRNLAFIGTMADMLPPILETAQYGLTFTLLVTFAQRFVQAAATAQAKPWWVRCSMLVGRLSFGIYLVHPALLEPLSRGLAGLGTRHILYMPLLLVLTTLSSTIVVYGLSCLPYSSVWLGTESQSQSRSTSPKTIVL